MAPILLEDTHSVTHPARWDVPIAQRVDRGYRLRHSLWEDCEGTVRPPPQPMRSAMTVEGMRGPYCPLLDQCQGSEGRL